MGRRLSWKKSKYSWEMEVLNNAMKNFEEATTFSVLKILSNHLKDKYSMTLSKTDIAKIKNKLRKIYGR